MLSFIRKIKFNKNYFPLLNQKCLISTSEKFDQINMIKQQNEKVLEIKINQQQKLKKTIRKYCTSKYEKLHSAEIEKREFLQVFPGLLCDLKELANKYDSKEAPEWFAKTIQYNLTGGKNNRGLFTVAAYKSLVDKNELTPENIRLVQILGWCLEMVQSTFLIIDDIMDYSITRRDQICWHKLENVGLVAVNDSQMIENSVFYILRKYFSQKPCYVAILELFHEIIFITTVGQVLDLQTANKNVTEFSMEKFKAIGANKTSYYTFYMPFALAMHMAGITDPVAFEQAKTLLLEIGEFYQVQDDFIDCFGDPTISGKIGTDIPDNKCTWLAVVCMQRANEKQRSIMMECYGTSDPDNIRRIKELYMELGLPDIYAKYEEDTYNMIKTHIEQISRDTLHEIFNRILDKAYRRKS